MTIKTKIATKTMTAPVKWDKENKITCYFFGEKDVYGKACWYDEDGNEYELIYARLSKKYSFIPNTRNPNKK